LRDKTFNRITDIKTNMKSIKCKARINKIFGYKNFIREDGSEGSVGWFKIYDKTGSIKVVLWDEKTKIFDDIDFELYSPVLIQNAYSKKGLDGEIELHLGKYGKIFIMNEKDCNIPIPSNKKRKSTSKNYVAEVMKELSIHEKKLNKKLCPHCGFLNLNSSKYCGKCGEPLK